MVKIQMRHIGWIGGSNNLGYRLYTENKVNGEDCTGTIQLSEGVCLKIVPCILTKI